jgi:hypothetical protein
VVTVPEQAPDGGWPRREGRWRPGGEGRISPAASIFASVCVGPMAYAEAFWQIELQLLLASRLLDATVK